MRKLFPIVAVLVSATTAHAGLFDPCDVKTLGTLQPSFAQRPDDSVLTAKRQAMLSAEADDHAEAAGNAKRNAAAFHTRAPTFWTSKSQTKIARRVSLDGQITSGTSG